MPIFGQVLHNCRAGLAAHFLGSEPVPIPPNVQLPWGEAEHHLICINLQKLHEKRRPKGRLEEMDTFFRIVRRKPKARQGDSRCQQSMAQRPIRLTGLVLFPEAFG